MKFPNFRPESGLPAVLGASPLLSCPGHHRRVTCLRRQTARAWDRSARCRNPGSDPVPVGGPCRRSSRHADRTRGRASGPERQDCLLEFLSIFSIEPADFGAVGSPPRLPSICAIDCTIAERLTVHPTATLRRVRNAASGPWSSTNVTGCCSRRERPRRCRRGSAIGRTAITRKPRATAAIGFRSTPPRLICGRGPRVS
jgi:hypothetical protein